MATGDWIPFADKTTLDAVKQDTTNILGKFPISGGTDWSGYAPFNDILSLSDTTAVGSSRTIKQITGAGYLDLAIINSNVSQVGYFQITIDGSVVMKTAITDVSYAQGFVTSDDLSMIFSSPANNDFTYIKSVPPGSIRLWQGGYSGSGSSQQSTFGQLSPDTVTSKNLVLNHPIFFKTSLKIEFISNNVSSKTLSIICRGGIKV